MLGRPIRDMREWKKFCTDIEGKDFRRLDADVNRIKEYLTKRGIVSDSRPVLKMDSHDTPLNFYQEGAEILPLDVFEAFIDIQRTSIPNSRARWRIYWEKRPEASGFNSWNRIDCSGLSVFQRYSPMQITVAAIEDPDQKQKQGAEPPLLNKRGVLGVSVFVEPVFSPDRWRAKISEARATPRVADVAQTER